MAGPDALAWAMVAGRGARGPRPLPASLLALLALLALSSAGVAAEAEAGAAAEAGEAAEEEGGSDADSVLKELTIGMGSDVVDERTLVMRDSGKAAKPGRKMFHLRLGNVAPIQQGDLSEEAHAAKREAAKKALAKFVEKQMVFWKAAPDSAQPAEQGSIETVIADLWTFEGHHINGALLKAGHLESVEEYHSDLARDILRAEAETQKKESYKKLEEALKENEKAKVQAAAEARKQKEKEMAEHTEPIGVTGWLCLGFLLILVTGAGLNFGRPTKKQKVNLNKKRGFFERLMGKIKGG